MKHIAGVKVQALRIRKSIAVTDLQGKFLIVLRGHGQRLRGIRGIRRRRRLLHLFSRAGAMILAHTIKEKGHPQISLDRLGVNSALVIVNIDRILHIGAGIVNIDHISVAAAAGVTTIIIVCQIACKSLCVTDAGHDIEAVFAHRGTSIGIQHLIAAPAGIALGGCNLCKHTSGTAVKHIAGTE